MKNLTRFLATVLFTCSVALGQHCASVPSTFLGAGDDVWVNGATPYPLGSLMDWDGQTYDAIWISTNGFVYLTQQGPAAAPSPVYNIATLSNFTQGPPRIAAMWTDLVLTPGRGGVYAGTSGGITEIVWHRAQRYGASSISDPEFSFVLKILGGSSIMEFTNGDLPGANCIVGVSAGNGAPNVAAIDFSVVSTSGYVGVSTGYEQFSTGAFDLGQRQIHLININGALAYQTHSIPVECAGITHFGSGCGTQPLRATSNVPVIGQDWHVRTDNVDAASPLVFTFFGSTMPYQGPPIPGAPGCVKLIDNYIASYTTPVVAGSSTVSVPVPAMAALQGLNVFVQTACLTASNPANLLTSNGLWGAIGL